MGRTIVRKTSVSTSRTKLDREEEECLVRAYQAGDNEADTRLLRVFEGLIRSIVIPLARRAGADQGDLLQEGRLGFLEGVKRFDFSRGLRLAAYAPYRVMHALRDPLLSARLIRLPAWVDGVMGEAAKRGIARAPDTLAEHGLVVEGSEAIASALACRRRPLSRPASTTRSGSSGQEQRQDRLLSDAPTPEQAYEQAAGRHFAKTEVAALLECLPPIQRDIIRRRYLVEDEPETLQAIAAGYGLSRERIRQLEVRALDTMARHARQRAEGQEGLHAA